MGGYTKSDSIGLRGGLNTYAYSQSDPTNSFDRLGLFTLHAGQTEELVGELPNIDEGDRRGPGLTIPLIARFRCRCTQCVDYWKLQACDGLMLLRVFILNDISEYATAAGRRAEDEHVQNFKDGVQELVSAAEGIEMQQRQLTFASKKECVNQTANKISAALRPVLQRLSDEQLKGVIEMEATRCHLGFRDGGRRSANRLNGGGARMRSVIAFSILWCSLAACSPTTTSTTPGAVRLKFAESTDSYFTFYVENGLPNEVSFRGRKKMFSPTQLSAGSFGMLCQSRSSPVLVGSAIEHGRQPELIRLPPLQAMRVVISSGYFAEHKGSRCRLNLTLEDGTTVESTEFTP